MKKKAVVYFVLWVIVLLLGTVFSKIYSLIQILEPGLPPTVPPYQTYHLFLILGVGTCVLLPLLGLACYHAFKEKNKPIKILSICLIIQHLICILAVLIQT